MDDKITKIRPFQLYFRVVLKQNGDILLLYCGTKSIDESCIACENIESGTVFDFALYKTMLFVFSKDGINIRQYDVSNPYKSHFVRRVPTIIERSLAQSSS